MDIEQLSMEIVCGKYIYFVQVQTFALFSDFYSDMEINPAADREK